MTAASTHPVRVLAIAPYESMTASLLRIVEVYPGILLEAYTGDLQEGVDIVTQKGADNYDAVLSRGGTADMIRRVTDLPVVEIPISVYDVLRVIKLAEGYADRSAIVGFPNITENAHTLCNLLRLNIPIKTVHDSNSVTQVLEELRSRGIHTVISDMITHRIARNSGFNALLITSGENSLQQALQEAETQGNSFRRMRNENLFLRHVLGQESQQCVVFNEEGELAFSYSENLPEELTAAMRHRISNIPKNREFLFYHQTHNALHAITGSAFYIHDQQYYLFRDQPNQIPLRAIHPGIRAYDAAECEHVFMNSIFSISGSMGEMEWRLSPVAASERAVIIVGEEGTGKEQIARALYLRSRFRNHPFIVVDGARLNDRGWNFLLEHHASPLSTSGTAIFFQHMEEAPPQRQRDLIALIEETGLLRRLWLLFSCDEKEERSLSEFSRSLSVRLEPLSMHLPPLRNRRGELSVLATLYLNRLNEELGKQISGFEPGAQEMLIRYDWPGNYSQFKHVLQELSILTTGPYISSDSVAELLAQERRVYRRNQSVADGFSFAGQTLEEINRIIAQQALNANGGNQSATAKQLGISRTTLWRMLSRNDMPKKE